MLKFLKEYKINDDEYQKLINSLASDTIEMLSLARNNVSLNLAYYNAIGIEHNELIHLLQVRSDLFLSENNMLKESINKVSEELFLKMAKNNPENLAVIGI